MQHQVYPHAHPRRASKKWWWILVLAVMIGGAVAAFTWGRGTEHPETLAVARGTVVETVSVTGRVTPASSVNLAFERGGKVSRVLAKVGDRVAARAPLVELDAQDLRASLREAEAQVTAARATLEKLRIGARPEEIAVKEAELAKAEQDLANYYTAALVTVEDAYAKADDAVRVKTDALFVNDETEILSLTFNVSDSQAQSDVVELRRSAGLALTEWNNELRAVRSSSVPSSIAALLANTQTRLATVRDYLARAVDAVNASIGLSTPTANTYRTDIGTGRTNVASATTAVSTVAQNLAAQSLTVAKTRSELALTKAGATAEELAAEEANLLQAEAARDAARSEIAKTVISAPFAGLVTKQDAKEGEIVAANVALVSLIAERSLEIEAFIPEVDVGKVGVGDIAEVTFDAYGQDEVFSVRVVRVEPAETVVEGVATYKTIFHFVDLEAVADGRVKSGMTANIEIETARQENVLLVPLRTLRGKNGGWVAFILNAKGEAVERPVTVGLRGTEGTVEITGGLSEGDRVMATPPRE